MALNYFLHVCLGSAGLLCHPEVSSVCFQVNETERATCCCLTVLLCHRYLCTEQPRGARGDYLRAYEYVCVCVCVTKGGNHCKETCRLPRVICAALVKWTSMMQQPHTHTIADTSNLSVSSAQPL